MTKEIWQVTIGNYININGKPKEILSITKTGSNREKITIILVDGMTITRNSLDIIEVW